MVQSFQGKFGRSRNKNMNDIFFDKNFNRKILKKWVSSQTSMLTENNGVTYIEKIEIKLMIVAKVL